MGVMLVARNRIDDVDRRLLSLLSADPRMSARALARAIGMSPGAVGERVERLQQAGVIRGFTLDVDPEALGFEIVAMIGVELRQGASVQGTINALRSISEVRSMVLVTGRWDLVLTLAARDQRHLRDVLVNEIWRVADFRHSETMVVLDSYSAGTLSALAELPDGSSVQD
jgi:Lrp/AsnC family transcriptional regulator, leucine-responsive regulatory protein